MKLRFAILGVLIALFVAPAFADSIQFDNKGIISASVGSSGFNVISVLNQISANGQVASGDLGTVGFSTGNFTGSLLGGGQFSAGSFDITINGSPVGFSATNFIGSWTKLSDDSYKLMGTFSAVVQGLGTVNGTSTQFFGLESEDGHLSFDDLHGKTTISLAAVPEPGTLTLLGTGLLGLGGMVRRKFATQ